jgi:hypothetical protein
MTSNQVGISDAVRDVLRHLESLVEEQRNTDKNVVSVAVGHSMGGKLLFTPMEERLEGDTNEPLPESPKKLPLFGEYVLLINPAQDIHDFEAFTDYAATLPSLPSTLPATVLIFSSEADGVIGRTYRISRSLRNVVTPANWRNFRSESVGLGWDEEQVTHALCPAKPDCLTESDPRPNGRPIRVCDEPCPAPFQVEEFNDTELRARSSNQGSFIVVRVDRSIISDHGDMFNDTFVSFLRGFIGKRVP